MRLLAAFLTMGVVTLITIAAFLVTDQIKYPSYGVGHTMAINVTKTDTGCQLYWLGGTDYDSFISDLKVGNVSIGHPQPGSLIYEGEDCNMTVGMYFRDVKAYQTIWPEDKR